MINRNNYEEFFLLYADNELSAAEKIEVENFVKENTDLEEELLMIKQAVLKPDNSIMMDKSALKNLPAGRQEDNSFINQKNYEERFIEYHDDELTAMQESAVMQFVGANKLQDEFALFAQAKMQPEQIPYPSKYLLYREKEKRRVVPFRRWMAVAAILTGVGLWAAGSFILNNENGERSEITVAKPPVFRFDIAKTKEAKIPDVQLKVTDQQKTQQPNQVEPNSNNSFVKNIVKDDKLKVKDQNIAQTPNKVNEKKEEQKLIAHIPKSEPVRNITIPENNIKAEPVVEKITEPQTNFPVMTASYVEEEKNENYAFYNITSEQFKKSKVGGFLKRVKREIGRRIPFNNEKQTQEVAIN